jgi:hypothetical protein
MFESPENRNVNIGGRVYKLELTCPMCPEQWDVYRDCTLVGYIRLRWGALRVDYPDCGGKTLLAFNSGTYGFGNFDTEELRNTYLLKLVKAIDEEILDQNPSIWRRLKVLLRKTVRFPALYPPVIYPTLAKYK